MAATRTQSAPAADRVLTVLELLSESRFGLSLAELVDCTGLPKSSLHCLVVTLQRRGYLYRNERSGRYVFGLKLFSLADRALGGLRIRDLAVPELRRLMSATGLTVHFAILENDEAVLVAKLEPAGTSRLATWIGKRMDLHCTGLGKALLAGLPPDAIDRIIRQRGLPRHNENTLSSPRRLKEDLALTVNRGFAVDDEEDEIGFRCVGAPVFSGPGAPVAALSLSGTTEQITRDNLDRLGRMSRKTAAAIGKILSGVESRADAVRCAAGLRP
jgi:DNA-binding IclR family transcriptional regulator